MSEADGEFLEAIKTVSRESNNISATQHFCLRLTDSLERLPRHVRNNLELEILQTVNDVEHEYVCDWFENIFLLTFLVLHGDCFLW